MSTPLDTAHTDDELEARRWMRGWASEGGLAEFGTGTATYDDDRGRFERYMVAVGGPGGWFVFLLNADGSPDSGHLEYRGFGTRILVPIPADQVGPFLSACRADKANRDAR